MSTELDLLQALADRPELLARIDELAGTAAGELAIQKQLRREFPEELVRAAVELHELRRRGQAKFARAHDMWYTRRGLEQSTAEVVARHKAQRFRASGGDVWDLCCGIGGDTLALAAHQTVHAVDLNPVAGWLAGRNAAVYDVADRVETVVADVADLELTDRLVHIDPDRRDATGRRSFCIDDYQPGPAFLEQLLRVSRGGAVKLSPGSDFARRFPGCEIELISWQGECREATVWYGELAGNVGRRATVLPSGDTLTDDAPSEASGQKPGFSRAESPGRLGAFVFDPDPAIVRAGLLDRLAATLRLRRLDADEEYLTGDEPIVSPFLQTFAVVEDCPFRDRALRAAIRAADVHELEIKSRHVAVDHDQLRRKLPRTGTGRLTLIIARIGGRRGRFCADANFESPERSSPRSHGGRTEESRRSH